MGCGTGILAIFAAMKGAVSVDAIDIDAWCYENSMENITRNECKSINVFQGDASLLNNQRYDIILANINRNILLTDLGIYAGCLNKNGLLLLSGFYLEDFNAINDRATENGLVFQEQKERNNWLSLKYLK
jgi:ribosomal protein L11 methyltransferase